MQQKYLSDFIINTKYEFWNDETKSFQKNPCACFAPMELSDVRKTGIKYLWISSDFACKERVLNLILSHYKFKFNKGVITIGVNNIKNFTKG